MNNKSIWELTTNIEKRNKLEKNIECDILIIGAGLAGILLGYFLKLESKNVVIVEANTIASGTTKNTTAKITAQHGLIYNKLLKTIGHKKSKLFYNANIMALNKYEELIIKNNIECDFEKANSYVYTTKSNSKLIKEYKAYKKLNIPGKLVKKTNLPFNVTEALVLKDQAMFNPLKFIKYISKDLKIYENTKVIKINKNIIECDNGNKIKANKIVIATHFPIIDSTGYFFVKQNQYKAHLLAIKTNKKVNGMYIDGCSNGLTLRDYKDYVILGGYTHKTGKKNDIFYFEKLKKEAKKYFEDCQIITQFSAQDCMSLDKMPYIGKYSKKENNIYVATGFNKWGMTGSMLSALILKDLLTDKENKYAKLLSPSRFNFLSSIPNLSKNLIQTIDGLLIKRILMKNKKIINLDKNESTIIKHRKKYLGIYKDENNQLFVIDARCPHLGCILSFNKEERAYECPCHGSKFNYKGELLSSPSIYNSKKYKL